MSSKIAANVVALAIAASFLCAPTRAEAQAVGTDSAMAQSLFDEGRKLMAANKFAEACPKLAESQRLEPALGTLLNLAVCHERSGRTATAWSELHDAMSIAKQEGRLDRVKYAREHIEAIEPHLSRLTVTRAPTAPPRVEVRIDDAVLSEAALGTAVTLDPGVHRIEVRATRKRTWRAEVTLGPDADRKSIEIPHMDDDASGIGVIDLSEVSTPGDSSMRADEPNAKTPGNTQRNVGYVVGGVGLVALGIGVVAGVQALHRWDVRSDNCPGDACNPVGLDADKSARRWATIADIGVGVGIAAVVTSVILVVTSKHGASGSASSVAGVDVVPMLGADRAGIGAGGRF